jgi:hypothetical protein
MTYAETCPGCRGDAEGCGCCGGTGVRRRETTARPACAHCGRNACHTLSEACETAEAGACGYRRMRAE